MPPDKLVINTDDVQMTEAARKAGVESIFKDISDAMDARVTHPKFGDIIRIPENVTIIPCTGGVFGEYKIVMLDKFPIGIIDKTVPDGMMRVG